MPVHSNIKPSFSLKQIDMETTNGKKRNPAVHMRLPEAAAGLEKPLLIWDGECGFCHYWVIRWKIMTGEAVAYETYQEVGGRFPSIPAEAFRRAAFLVEPNGNVYRGMGAAYRTFTYGSGWGFLFRLYERSSLFRNASDYLYRLIARHRPLFFRLTKLLWGKNPVNPKLYCAGVGAGGGRKAKR